MTEPDFRIPEDECIRCRTKLSEWGLMHFRAGGTTGMALLFAGSDVGEHLVPLRLRYCSNCGQVDIRLPLPVDPKAGSTWKA